MNEDNLVLVNKLLFLDLPQAISQLDERTLQYGHRDHLIVVLSPDAMPIASQIARASKLRITIPVVERTKAATLPGDVIEFEFSVVKESGRDLPQDFIFHEERNLRARLNSIYKRTYKEISSQYPNDEIILVDELIHNGLEFRPKRDMVGQSMEGGLSEPEFNGNVASKVIRRFAYLHSINKNRNGVNIIIDQTAFALEPDRST